MKQFIAVFIAGLSLMQLSAQEYRLNKSFQELEEILDVLSKEKEDKGVFDFLIKYYQDKERLEERFVGVDNIDSPDSKRNGEFKMNRMVPFNLYPNSDSGSFNIDFYGDKGDLKILDSHGNLVRDQSDVLNGKYLILSLIHI